MGYFDSVWSNLVFNAGNTTSQFVNSLNWRYQKTQGGIKYVSRSAYKSALVHVAKQLAMSTLEGELNSLLPRYEKYARDKMRDAMRTEQDANRKVLINNGKKSTEDFGFIICEGGHKLIAKTKYGTPVPEALILSFDGEDKVHYDDVLWDENSVESYTIKKKSTLEQLWNPGNEIQHTTQNYKADPFDTKTVFHIDLAPKVSMNSSKNIFLTLVQGRVFTRKDLVSGGDMTYTIRGSIVSNDEGVYPTEAVKRFVKIMQHNGIVNVNFITFGLLGVTRVIIKDFSLDSAEYKNIQPYSFTCVAVEPDDAITIQSDTIAVINKDLAESQWDSWYKTILDNKLAQMAAKTALNVATNTTSSLAGAGLDELLPNI